MCLAVKLELSVQKSVRNFMKNIHGLGNPFKNSRKFVFRQRHVLITWS